MELSSKEFKLVQNCTHAVVKLMQKVVNASTGHVNTMIDPGTELFDAWALYIGDPGNYGSCHRDGNLYCAVETNHSGYRAESGVCLPPPCTVEQVETIAKSSIKNSHAGKYTGGFALQSVTCFPAQTEMPWKAAATFLVMLILIFIIIVATGVDLYLGHGHNGKSRFDYHAANDGSCEKHPRNVSGTQLLSPINGGGRSSLHHNVAQLSSDTQHCGCEEDRDHFRKAASISQIFRCFSVKRSWELLTARRKECSRGLRVLDGMKVLSILWIIFGQTLFIQARLYDNTLYVISEVERTSWHIILMGTLAPDTFLFIGGFLASYRVLHVYAFQGHAPTGFRAVKGSIQLILRRYFRLTPLLGLVLAFYYLALPSIIGGPIWSLWMKHPDYADCTQNWWTLLVYGNNLVDSQCMSWTWYTAVDFQLFFIVPFVTLAFWHFGVVALGGVLMLMIASIVINAIEVSKLGDAECTKNIINFTSPLTELETKPWIRAVPYLLGITLSFLYNAMGEFEGTRNFRGRPVMKAAVWFFSGLALALPVFGNIGMQVKSGEHEGECRWNHAENAAYLSLYRISWSIGIFLLTGSCLVGWGHFISKLLSARAWAPFSRLVYGVFLVHPILIEIRAYGGNSYDDFSEISYVLEAAGFVFLSFFIATFFFLLVEGPLYQIRQLAR